MANELDLDVIGSSGLKQSGGIVDEEFHPKLRGGYAPKLYREMSDNSSTIGAIRYLFKALVRQVEWRVNPADANIPAAVEQAAFLESNMVDMSMTFEDIISEALSCLDYGWSYFELCYKLRKGDTDDPTTRSKYNDGKIGWRKMALRSQDTRDHWEFDEDGGLRGMWQVQDEGAPVLIPIEKAILFRTETTKGNPEGRSIYRNAVVDYFFLKRICEIEAVGIERDMTGMITMEVPLELLMKNATAEHKALLQALEKMLSELKRDEREFAIVPAETDRQGNATGYKLKLLNSGGSRQIDTNGVKLYYKTNILQSVLAQFLQLGLSGVGSFALASTQTDLFAVSLGNYLNMICSVFNRFAVARLMDLNGVPSELWPEIVHGDIETPPLGEIGSYIQALASAGQLPEDDGIKRRLLEIARLPIPEAPTEVTGETTHKEHRFIRPVPIRLPSFVKE